MTALVWLNNEDLSFPDINNALSDPNGLLAAGGDLSSERLIAAYRQGIFPWYDEGQPILWWSPDPRCVIDPSTFSPSKSLARRLRRTDYMLGVDRAFEQVIEACQVRGSGEGTWITDDMKAAYIRLHDIGVAHSIECYIDDELAGGLYGIGIGPFFFGESMFHRQTDASKMAFAGLMALMVEHNCPLVDCQLTNPHLLSLGAVEISRDRFRQLLEQHEDAKAIDWAPLKGTLFRSDNTG